MSDERDPAAEDEAGSSEPATGAVSEPVTPDAEFADFEAEPPEEQERFDSFWHRPHASETRPRAARMFFAWLLAAALGAGGGAGGTYLALRDRPSPAGGSSGNVRVVQPPVGSPVAQDPNAAARVASAVLPSIVQIQTSLSGGGESIGSGVIYREDGYIVTNNHVVDGADTLSVHLSTGEKLAAALVGTAAPAVDIAVVKVAKTGLPAATFGSTKDIRVGDLAVAIGSPFGLEGSVTSGIVSALHRDGLLGGQVRLTDAIQTDAAINHGNSGGALADAQGAVIGINTAIVPGESSGGNVGVGFAIPSDIVRKVTDQIIATGHAQLAFLGISGTNLPSGDGALVQTVQSGGPADKAGVHAGDVIVSLAGAKVASMDALIAMVIQKNVGDKVQVGLLRNGKKIDVTVTLAARPEG